VIGRGSSFGDYPLTPTIGLGRARAIDAVEIAWPDGGTRQVARDLPLDRAVVITEGEEGFRLLDRAPIPRPGAPTASMRTRPSDASGIPGSPAPDAGSR
jgi:ASPIC and UnbV